MSDVAAAATAQSRCYSWVSVDDETVDSICERRAEKRRREGGTGTEREESIICYLTCIINIFRAPTEKQPAAAVADADATSPMDLFSLFLSPHRTHRSLALQVDSDESIRKDCWEEKEEEEKKEESYCKFLRRERTQQQQRSIEPACVCVGEMREWDSSIILFFFWIEFQSENI
jgi:hypothetical protein